jgi:hypothetical protein
MALFPLDDVTSYQRSSSRPFVGAQLHRPRHNPSATSSHLRSLPKKRRSDIWHGRGRCVTKPQKKGIRPMARWSCAAA